MTMTLFWYFFLVYDDLCSSTHNIFRCAKYAGITFLCFSTCGVWVLRISLLRDLFWLAFGVLIGLIAFLVFVGVMNLEKKPVGSSSSVIIKLIYKSVMKKKMLL
jgi:hypothetical protein